MVSPWENVVGIGLFYTDIGRIKLEFFWRNKLALYI
jgi:hypothetical protein